jgi:hypothetical protein
MKSNHLTLLLKMNQQLKSTVLNMSDQSSFDSLPLSLPHSSLCKSSYPDVLYSSESYELELSIAANTTVPYGHHCAVFMSEKTD